MMPGVLNVIAVQLETKGGDPVAWFQYLVIVGFCVLPPAAFLVGVWLQRRP